MQLAPMQFSKIDGTAVSVSVQSAAEAKVALKELRHKKRELKFLRSALLRQRKAARASRPKRKHQLSGLPLFFDDLRWAMATLRHGKQTSDQARRKLTAPEIERELKGLDETLHNIEGCILQLQGKLLARS